MGPLGIIWALIFIGILWFSITQILLPLAEGTKLFPLFQKSAKMEGELHEVREKVAQKKVKETIKQEKEKLNA